MRRIYTYTPLASLLIYPLFSQAQRTGSSHISVDFGINTTLMLNQNIYGNQELPYSPKYGFSGLASYKHFISNYGYSFGLGFINLGQKYSGDVAGSYAKRRINLNYLQLPLNCIYTLDGMRQPTRISFGPQVLILLSAQQDFIREAGRVLPNPELLSEGSTDVVNRFKPVDVMLNFEITRLFSFWATNVAPYRPAGNVMWSVSADGTIGITDINRKTYQLTNLHNVYGGSHNFYLGVKIGLMLKMKAKNILDY